MGTDSLKIITVRIHDDTPGFKETFWKGPFETREEAQAICDRFNANHGYKGSKWCSWVEEREEMPYQEEWEKNVFSGYN